MGTNYYHRRNVCDCCGRFDLEHIGKSSIGWQFTFHATATERTFQDWATALRAGGTIEDEYGCGVSVDDFLALVESKRTAPNNHAALYTQYGDYIDPEGYSMSPGDFT